MTTQVEIKNNGPYVITVQRADEPLFTVEPQQTLVLSMWVDASIKIEEPPGFHKTKESYRPSLDTSSE